MKLAFLAESGRVQISVILYYSYFYYKLQFKGNHTFIHLRTISTKKVTAYVSSTWVLLRNEAVFKKINIQYELMLNIYSFRCIIFLFAASRIHKKHIQLGHVYGHCGNNNINHNRSHVLI